MFHQQTSLKIDNLAQGITFLTPKKRNCSALEHRPTICLNTMYKLVTKLVSDNIYYLVMTHSFFSKNQLGNKKNTQSVKELLL